MKTLLNAILAMFGVQPNVDMGSVLTQGFKEEHPSLADKRNIAKQNMECWGRKTLLEGGDFKRNLTVLRGQNTV